MQIYAHERGNPYGCTYFISFHEIELVILLVWKDNLNKMADVSTSAKRTIYQFIEKTNSLLYLSYKELH